MIGKPIAIAFLGLAVALAGCAKKKECSALTEVIKTERATFSKNPTASTADDFAKMAAGYQRASAKIREVEVSVPELKKERDDYLGFLDDMSNAADLTSKALGGDVTKVGLAKNAADKVQDANEPELYAAINKTCGN